MNINMNVSNLINCDLICLQAVWVFCVSLPVIFTNAPASSTIRDYWTVMDIIGLVMFCIGLLIEAVADQSKFMFRNDPKNKGKWCNTGKAVN